MQPLGPYKTYCSVGKEPLHCLDIVTKMEDIIPKPPERVRMLLHHSAYFIRLRNKFAEGFRTISLQ